MSNYPLILLSRPPYDGSLARAALDLALGFAVFNQQPRLLFTADGVLQLTAQGGGGLPSLRKVIDSLSLYDIDQLFADEDALQRRGIASQALPKTVTTLDRDAVMALRRNAGHLLSL